MNCCVFQHTVNVSSINPPAVNCFQAVRKLRGPIRERLNTKKKGGSFQIINFEQNSSDLTIIVSSRTLWCYLSVQQSLSSRAFLSLMIFVKLLLCSVLTRLFFVPSCGCVAFLFCCHYTDSICYLVWACSILGSQIWPAWHRKNLFLQAASLSVKFNFSFYWGGGGDLHHNILYI